jgi:hypothetical protein
MVHCATELGLNWYMMIQKPFRFYECALPLRRIMLRLKGDYTIGE